MTQNLAWLLVSLFPLLSSEAVGVSTNINAALAFETMRPDSALLIRPADVVEECSRILAEVPIAEERAVEAVKCRGKAYLRLEKFAEAQRDLDKVCRKRPDDADAHGDRADALTYLRRYDEALEEARILIRQDSKSARGYQILARIAFLQGKTSEGLQLIDRAMSFEESSPESYYLRAVARYQMNDFAGSLEDLNRYITLHPLEYAGDPAEPYCRRAVIRVRLNHREEALGDFLMARKLNPRSAHAVGALAILYARRGELRLSLSLAQEWQTLDPSNAIAYLLYAQDLARTGRKEQALEALRELMSRSEAAKAGVLGSAGAIYFYLGQYQDAIHCFDRALALNPTCCTALVGKARLLACCPEEPRRNGRLALELALQGEKGLPSEERWYGAIVTAEAYAECGDFDRASDAVRRALELGGRDLGEREDLISQMHLFAKHEAYRYHPPQEK